MDRGQEDGNGGGGRMCERNGHRCQSDCSIQSSSAIHLLLRNVTLYEAQTFRPGQRSVDVTAVVVAVAGSLSRAAARGRGCGGSSNSSCSGKRPLAARWQLSQQPLQLSQESCRRSQPQPQHRQRQRQRPWQTSRLHPGPARHLASVRAAVARLRTRAGQPPRRRDP